MLVIGDEEIPDEVLREGARQVMDEELGKLSERWPLIFAAPDSDHDTLIRIFRGAFAKQTIARLKMNLVMVSGQAILDLTVDVVAFARAASSQIDRAANRPSSTSGGTT